MNIVELAKRRMETKAMLNMLGMMNQPADYKERLALDAMYQLAKDAYNRIEKEYQDELAKLSNNELIALTKKVYQT